MRVHIGPDITIVKSTTRSPESAGLRATGAETAAAALIR
jgi:hypothetical protein